MSLPDNSMTCILYQVPSLPDALTPDTPFIKAYVSVIPGLILERNMGKAFNRAISTLSNGICCGVNCKDEDGDESDSDVDPDLQEGVLSWADSAAHAWMISNIMGWSATDIERVTSAFDRFAQSSASIKDENIRASTNRVVTLLNEHKPELQEYALQYPGDKRKPAAITLRDSKAEIADDSDGIVTLPVTISSTGWL